MSTQYEIRRFVFSKPPQGAEIADLVSRHKLESFEVSIEKKLNDNNTGIMFERYRWEVEFTRRAV